jgi:hypothetical protein
MAKETMKDRLIAALRRRGCETAASRSTKYEVLENPKTKVRYFVGKNGALRIGETVTGSISASDDFKKALLEAP